MKHRIEFTLRQHTPLIHFQHDQPGATLRATELKPKLDRFLIERFPNLPHRTHPNGSLSLDYRITIKATNQKVLELEHQLMKNREPATDKKGRPRMATFPTFFANMGNDWKSNPKKLSLSSEVYVSFFCFDPKIKQHIDQYFPTFVNSTNFGMRQSKGFGSFEAIERNGRSISFEHEAGYMFQVDLNTMNPGRQYWNKQRIPESYFEYEKLFYAINRFHQALRSGINENGFYFKPFSFFYAKSQGVTWDKRNLKKSFLDSSTIQEQKKRHHATPNDPLCYEGKPTDKFLVRDMLGLSTEQLWLKYGFTVRHPKENSKDRFHGEPVKDNYVKRMKSPLLYKPVKQRNNLYNVYIVFDKYPDELFDHDFTILKDSNGRVVDKVTGFKAWKDFDLERFFTEILSNKLENQMNNKNHTIGKELSTLFNTLQKVGR